MTPRFFGRLGTNKDVNKQVTEARHAGAEIKRDRSAGTIEAKLNNDTIFRALQKDSSHWIVMYNPNYYPAK